MKVNVPLRVRTVTHRGELGDETVAADGIDRIRECTGTGIDGAVSRDEGRIVRPIRGARERAGIDEHVGLHLDEPSGVDTVDRSAVPGRETAPRGFQDRCVALLQLRRDVEQRRECEGPALELAMRHLKRVALERPGGVPKNVEVEASSRPSLHDRPIATEPLLHLPNHREDLGRREVGLDRERGVEVVRLRWPDGRRLVERRGSHHLHAGAGIDEAAGALNRRLTRSEVRAHTDDDRPHDNEWTVPFFRTLRRPKVKPTKKRTVPFVVSQKASTLSPMSDMPLFERFEEREPNEGERVFRVGEINRAVRYGLEDAWPSVLIEGELSDVRRARGHVYFSLNDEEDDAQLRGVMFQSDVRRTKAPLEDGARIRFRGKLSLYQPRGQFQLIARSAKLAGEGDLAARFARLRKKLEAEGLLDADRKRPLPRLPRVVGVVTSRSGAAVRDIIRVASERCPVRLIVVDCRVQGEDAPATIVSAIERVQKLPNLDVVIVSRGGGAAEDLWAFNDEGVARAISACRVPVVSGVGHEVDVTIADLVADVRAATPSNAAELVVPERDSLVRELQSLERRLSQALDGQVGGLRLRLERLLRPLYGARRVIAPIRRSLLDWQDRLAGATRAALRSRRRTLTDLRGRLDRLDPRSQLRADRRVLGSTTARLRDAGRIPIERRRQELIRLTAVLRSRGRPLVREARAKHAEAAARLDALSPLRVLDRGYAIAVDPQSKRAVRKVSEVEAGDRLRIKVSDGDFPVTVEDES